MRDDEDIDTGRSAGDDAAPVIDERVAQCVRREHAVFLDTVAAVARVTAKTWGDEAPAQANAAESREAVVEPFERVLRETGTLDAATAVLADAVDAAGGTLRADPVPDPPYVAVTSRGLVLRATTEVGRVVVAIVPFAVERDPVRYRLRGDDSGAAVAVQVEVHDAT